MVHSARFPTLALSMALLVSACGRSSDIRPEIRLNAAHDAIDVVLLPSRDLAVLGRTKLSAEQWSSLLRISVAGEQAAVVGKYSVTPDAIRFEPLFPFDPGRVYDVVFEPSRLPGSAAKEERWRSERVVAAVSRPASARGPATSVVAVYPTTDSVPENQLRMYVQFSAPMGLQGGLSHVHLLDERNREVPGAFVPVEVALWNADRTRYTMFFDPGRVKRGVLPNEQMGRALESGRRYAIVVDADWRDGWGQPLTGAFRREFRAGPAEERPIDPAVWELAAPRAGSRDPLVVTFQRPLDYGLLHRALGVSNARGGMLDGDVAVDSGETRWLFTPRVEWQDAAYRLVALAILEDAAGNRIGRAFETGPSDRSGEDERVVVPFRPVVTSTSR